MRGVQSSCWIPAFFVLVACMIVHCMTSSEIDALRSTLLSGVSQIHNQLPGYLFSHGPNSIPLILGSGNRAAVVAATYGSGSVCAFGHNGYAYISPTSTDSLVLQTGQLLKNCAQWATGYKSNVTYMLHGVSKSGGSSFYNTISGFVLNSTTDAFSTSIRPLETVDLVIMNLNSVGEVSSDMFNMLDQFLKRGGGLIVVATAWAHSITTPVKFPGNVFLARAGISWYTSYFSSSPFVSSLSMNISDLNPYWKLDEIVNTGSLGLSNVKTVGSMLSDIYPSLSTPLSLNTIETFGKAKTAYDSMCNPNSIVIPATTAQSKFCINMVDMLNKANALPLENNPQIVQAEKFPGTAAGLSFNNASIVSVDVTISTQRKRWQCSGYYALPGANITITVSNTYGISGIVIGSHTDDISNSDTWNRWPTISSTFYLSSSTNSTSWFIATNGGTIFFDVSVIPLSFTARIVGQVVKTPFFRSDLHTNTDWLQIRNYPGPWVEIESAHFVFNVESSYARSITDAKAITDYWESVMLIYYDLSQRGIRDYKERFQVDKQISIGYMHSGYPIMAFQDQNANTLAVPNSAQQGFGPSVGRWGHYHELGHNFQVGAWTNGQATELTCNIFSMRLEEEFPDGVNVWGGRNYNPPNRGGNENYFKGLTTPYKGDWTSAGMLFNIDQIIAFGWVSIRKLFAEYAQAPSNELPSTDQDKNDQWLIRFSRIVNRNMAPFHDMWSVPISDAARRNVSSYPAWMPDDYIVDCNKVPFEGSPCLSMKPVNPQQGKTTEYEITLTTWAPVRSIYGERLVFTLSGALPTNLVNGTSIPLTMLNGTTSLNSTANVILVNNTIQLSVFANTFIKSGIKLKFSFSGTNSANVGKIYLSAKQIDKKGTLINVIERPMETPAQIVVATASSVNVDFSVRRSVQTSGGPLSSAPYWVVSSLVGMLLIGVLAL